MDSNKAFLLELARRVKLEENDFDLSDEYGAAVYSVWKLLGIKNFPDRKNCVSNIPEVLEYYSIKPDTDTDDEDTNIRFTAHSHRCGIMDESPDDMMLYLTTASTSDVNFIVDDFNCRKVGY